MRPKVNWLELKREKLFDLPSRQVGDVDEGVVEGCIDVGNGENLLAFTNLGSERDLDLFNFLLLSFARGHFSILFKNNLLKYLFVDRAHRKRGLKRKRFSIG
jgi:hypothetical protein